MAMWLLWILPLAASFLLPATGEVMPDFKNCSQFFFNRKEPNLVSKNPAIICQRYRNRYHFATMYDKTLRIPLFSAYIYQPGTGKRQKNWKIEPQLALPGDQNRKSMELERGCKINATLLRSNQAVSVDYNNAVDYDRGHLAPSSHQPNQDSKDATFTLTNIVPQFSDLNQKKWEEYEKNMTSYTTGCRATYVIVGAVPGNTLLNKRVNKPSHIWAAACCVLQNSGKKSWAVIAENDKNKVDHLTLGQLQTQLATLYKNKIKKSKKKNIDLFNSAC